MGELLAMPAPLLSREEVIARLLETFRASGYDGASLAALSQATGLGKSSLYHYFPGGKEEMVAQVLAFLEAFLEEALFAPLREAGPPAEKLGAMLDTLTAFYDGGKKACLLERLCASVSCARFQPPLQGIFLQWIAALERLCIEGGVPAPAARIRAEDAVIRVEGALILSAGTNNTGAFTRTIQALRTTLLLPVRPPYCAWQR